MEIRAAFHFSWVYTFSATLSSLRNWAHNDRYRLRPNTPAQLCWSSSRLQPLQNYNLIKFAIIRPSTLNHDRNLWNCRVAPDETTYLTGFFRCPSALALIWTKLFNVCVNKLSLSIDTRHQWLAPPEKILGYATAHEPKSRTPRDPFGVSHWYSRLTNPKSKQKSRTTIYLPLPCFSRKCRCYARAPLRIFTSPSLRPRP